jgi:hypothetical protein
MVAATREHTRMIAQLNRSYITANPAKVWPRLLSYFFFEGRPATTKGRWFNPVTFRSLRNAALCEAMPESESPIFITGTGRSGSTILGLVLSSHPDTGFLNEPKALWFLANPKDDIIGSYSNGPANYMMNAGDATPEIAAAVKAMYSCYLKRSGTKRIIDKFPEMIFRIEYLNKIFSDPKYIFLHRNAKETIASTAIWSDSHRQPNQNEDWWGVEKRKWKLLTQQVVPGDELLSPFRDVISGFTSQSDMAAVEWIVTMNRGLKMQQAFPDKVLPVKYEDLARDQEATLKRICEFTGLSADKKLISFGVQTIKPSLNGHRIEIHPVLHEPVAVLSEKLGYKTYSPSMSVTE